MKKYYTTINFEEGSFVGELYHPVTNQLIYKSIKYNTQAQAQKDINDYISTLKPENSVEQSNNSQTPIDFKTTPRACCGQRS